MCARYAIVWHLLQHHSVECFTVMRDARVELSTLMLRP